MRRLSTRLFLSHVLVALVGALTTFAIVRFGAAALFERDVNAMPGMMHGQGQGQLRQTFVSAINTAMVVGVLVSLLVAAAGAALLGRRLLRPVEDVRTATRQIARGDYAHRAPVPAEPELAALAHDVNALGSALAETEARRVRLLGDIAHELRTPLTVMEGQLEGLADGVFEPGPAAYADLEAEVARMRRLAADLGDLSRVEEGRLEPGSELVDLRSVVTAVTGRLGGALSACGVSVDHVPSSAPVLVRGDEQRLVQVVTNLVNNAAQAMPGGGRLDIDVTHTDGRATIRVCDTGRGLAADDLERVFERFYRVPDSTGSTRRDGGTGIGLTVSRGIARAMGGDLTASSPGVGQGAEFTLTLPVATDTQDGRQLDQPMP
ncbi:Signal transduction histidine kinase [Pedococcus cremeus]|uniref:histidine kinase n=1 Tax=Pedococcus cremeus TaxID=587636 RepID=A0A1H9URM7_9MICO|nr:HAMP domain-containing sensor histidine kinase [Pedococcus cremeus]SES11707.1 Signal transduction histidine kinase [Pedococcus cremeus]